MNGHTGRGVLAINTKALSLWAKFFEKLLFYFKNLKGCILLLKCMLNFESYFTTWFFKLSFTLFFFGLIQNDFVCLHTTPHLAFYVGSEALSSSPQACKAVTSVTELSLQPSLPLPLPFLNQWSVSTQDLHGKRMPNLPSIQVHISFISLVPQVSHYIVMTKMFCLTLSDALHFKVWFCLYSPENQIEIAQNSNIAAGTIKNKTWDEQ